MESIEKKKICKAYGLECDVSDDSALCQIGITGMMMAPIQLAGKMFGVGAFLQGIVGSPYDIQLSYGEKSAFYIRGVNWEWELVEEDTWHEFMSGLTDKGLEEFAQKRKKRLSGL